MYKEKRLKYISESSNLSWTSIFLEDLFGRYNNNVNNYNNENYKDDDGNQAIKFPCLESYINEKNINNKKEGKDDETEIIHSEHCWDECFAPINSKKTDEKSRRKNKSYLDIYTQSIMVNIYF